MGASERSEHYYVVTACAIAGVGWLCWLAFGLGGWPDRLYLVSLTAVLGTIIWMARLGRRDRDMRGWVPAIVASLGLLAMISLSLPEGPEHVADMAYAGLAGAIAAWAIRLAPRIVPAIGRRQHPLGS
jgi:hypothetical protein